MKPNHVKVNDISHRDTVPFIRSCSAAEIFEAQGIPKANRENQPPRSRNQDSKQFIKLDAIFGDCDSQSLLLREKDSFAQGPTNLPDRKRHHASKEIIAPTPTLQMLQLHSASQHTLNSADDENQRLLLKLLRQTKNQLGEKQQESDSRFRQQLSSLKTMFTEVRRQLEEIDKRTCQQAKKISQTCSSMKLEYRNAFSRMVEQVNNKFINNDKLFVELREQGAVARSSIELFEEELEKKIKELHTGQIELLTRLNNNIKVDELSQSEFVAELQSDDDPDEQRLQKEDIEVGDTHQDKFEELAAEVQRLKAQYSEFHMALPRQSSGTQQDFELFKIQLTGELAVQQQKAIRELQPKLEESNKRITELSEQVIALSKAINQPEKEDLRIRLSILEKRSSEPLFDKSIEVSTDRQSEPLDQRIILSDLQRLKEELEDKMRNSRVVFTKRTTAQQKIATDALKSAELSQTYFVDEEQHLMSSQGQYLLDDNNQRIKINPDQFFFLSLHGLRIGQICKS